MMQIFLVAVVSYNSISGHEYSNKNWAPGQTHSWGSKDRGASGIDLFADGVTLYTQTG